MTRRPYDLRSWRTQRRRVLERDGWSCRVCGVHKSQLPRGSTDLTAGHVMAHAAGGPETMSNLVTLCNRCHGRIDGGRRYA